MATEPKPETSEWSTAAISKLLDAHDYRTAYDIVWNAMKAQDVQCADFIRRHNTHVLLAYTDARNSLHVDCSVKTTTKLKEALVRAIFLLARVAQDVDACFNTLSQRDVERVLKAFYRKVIGWLAALATRTHNGTTHWPSLTDVVETVRAKLKPHTSALPSPIWAPFFSQSAVPMRYHMYFGKPDEAIVASASRVTLQINASRQTSLKRFLNAVKRSATWDAFLKHTLDRIRTLETDEEEDASAALPSSPVTVAAAASSHRVRKLGSRMLLRRV